MELGFSSYAVFADHDAHYSVWVDAGAVAMPQTYTNEFTWATPEAGMAGATDVKQPHNPPNGWPRHLVYPTIGNYPVAGVQLPTAQEYADFLRRAHVVSFSIYLGELVHEGELQHYAGVCVAPPAPTPEPAPGPVVVPERAPAKPPLSVEEVPFTGPRWSLSDNRGPSYGPTVVALKMAMRRLGIGDVPDVEDYYSLELENALRLWQKRVGVRPATGQYGRASYEKLRAAVAADGEYALDAHAIELIKSEAAAPP
jgi:hypothetical protein